MWQVIIYVHWCVSNNWHTYAYPNLQCQFTHVWYVWNKSYLILETTNNLMYRRLCFLLLCDNIYWLLNLNISKRATLLYMLTFMWCKRTTGVIKYAWWLWQICAKVFYLMMPHLWKVSLFISAFVHQSIPCCFCISILCQHTFEYGYVDI